MPCLFQHYRVFARMERAYVREPYWDVAHNVLRPPADAALPPLLSFLGSKHFACLT